MHNHGQTQGANPAICHKRFTTKKKSSKVQKIMEFSIKLTLKTLCVLSVKHHRPENMTDNPKGIIDNMKTMNSVQHINVFTVN